MNDQQIFAEARRQKTSFQRNAYLTRACGGDATRERRIERLLTMLDVSVPLLDCEPLSLLSELSVDLDSGGRGDDSLQTDVIEQIVQRLQPTADESLGRLSHYRVLSVIGHGGFGVVAKAIDEKLQREVAIKFLSPALSAEREHQERFLSEARSVAAIRHENVVQIYAVEEHPLPYIVMEYVAGQTLHEQLNEGGPMCSDEVIRISKQVALGLDAAHSRQIVHRDIKPANILLESGDAGRVVLTDFGLAFSTDDVSLPQSGQLMGTPAYMAPEQVSGSPIDCRADLFSFGAVMYRMCIGVRPFMASSTTAMLQAVTDHEAVSLSSLQSEVLPGLADLIDRLLAKQPDHRPQSAMDIVHELEKCEVPAGHLFATFGKVTAAFAGVLLLVGLSIFFNSPGVAVSESTASSSSAAVRIEASVSAQPEQIEDVIAELVERNDGFNSDECHYEITSGRITGFSMPSTSDYSPLAALTDLETLNLQNASISPMIRFDFVTEMKSLRVLKAINIPIEDLQPLAGLQLQELHLWNWTVGQSFKFGDLSPLQGMPLTYLNCGGGPLKNLEPLSQANLKFLCVNSSGISELTPVRGMPIEILLIEHTNVDNLSVLSGMPLRELAVSYSKVSDLSPVLGAPLEILRIDGAPIGDYGILARFSLLKEVRIDDPLRHAEILRQLPLLQVLNDRPIEEFWKQVEAEKSSMAEELVEKSFRFLDGLAEKVGQAL